MFKAKLNISAAIILFLSLMSSTVFSAVLLGPEFVNSNSGSITTFVKTLNLGDNLPGKYLLKLQNGSNGPALLQLCDTKPTIELKRQCQYENLVDRIENQLTRLNSLTIRVNGQLISTTSLLNKSTSYLEFPINLNLAINEIKISVLGNPEAFASVQIEELPAEALPPRALFSINSNRGRAPFILKYNATQSFDPLNKALTYQWFVDDVQISDLKIGSYTLQNPGESILKLKVTNSDGATSELSAVIMTLNPIVPATNLRPIPKLIVSYPDPLNLRLIKVSALDSYDPDGVIVKTEINWGDTFKSLSSEALHQFATDGTFLVSVRVTDDLGLVSAIEKSVPISLNTQLSKVSSLFGPNTYYGSFSAYNDYVETINLSAIDAAELYRVKIKNADGKDHLVRICSGTVSENIMCAYNNLLSRAYIALYRVDYANIYINNKKITDSTSINKNQKSFSTYLKLAEINQLKIRLKGWPTAYIDVEIEKLGQVADTTPPVLSSNVDSGTNTRSNLVHIYVEDNSLVTTEIYKNDVLVATATTDEFDLTLSEGVNNFVLKAKDTENNVAADFILSNITLDSTPPIPTQMDLKAKYIFTTLPQTVTLNFSTNEDLSSATANGEALTQISQTQYQYQIQVFDPVKTVVQVRFKDLVGNEGVGNYSFLTEIDVTAPVLAIPTVLPSVTKLAQVTAAIRITEKNNVTTVIKVNGEIIGTSALKSFNQIIPLTDEGLNTIEAISTDVVGNVSNIITRQITKDSTGPQLSLTPANDAVIPTLTAIISGTSNEPMTQVLVAGKAAVLSADKLSFSYNYVATTYGIKNLAIQAKDVLGNISVQNISYNVNNSTIPVITTNITNGSVTNNQNIQVNAIGTGINSLQVLLDDQELLNQDQTSFSFLVTGDGEHKVDVIAKNTAGHITSQTYNFTFDATAPFINLTSGVVGQTTEDLITVSYSFWDLSATTFRVMAGQTIIYQSTESVGTFDIPLLTQGTHRISVFAIDAANNMSEPLIFEIIKDNTNPIVTILSPTANELIDGNQIKVKALVDDPVASVTVNGQAMTWDDTEAAWTGTLVTNSTDDFLITVLATNTLNLNGESSVTVKPLLSPLVPALLGLYEDAINHKILVKGAAGSTRPFLNVKIKSGIFSSETIQADKNGSFMASLDIKDEYTVVVDDPLTGIEHKHKLTKFLQQTILSGLVKDNNDMPLEGVVVSIGSSNMQATTNQSGVFTFRTSDFPDSRVTGDQVITISGANANNQSTTRLRKFSSTTMNVSLSHRQNNVIQKTIYLYPQYLDTAQTLGAAGGGVITSSEAPGVTLSVGSDVYANFPSGQYYEQIQMFIVNSEKLPVAPPNGVYSENAIVFEPSGTYFSKDVELSVPNSSNFPRMSSMYLLLFNSKTGKWEIGGIGRVNDDATQIITKTDQGLRHFSVGIFVPPAADIMSAAHPDKPGADSFSGAVTNKIDAASFKIMGQTVSPGLIYNSAWAKPSTTITNIFNIPEKEIIAGTYLVSGSIAESYVASEVSCKLGNGITREIGEFSRYLNERLDPSGYNRMKDAAQRDLEERYKNKELPPTCYHEDKKYEFYQNLDYEYTYTNLQTTISSPKEVKFQFSSSDIIQEKKFGQIPLVAQLSQFIELKDKDGAYLKSGIYPYLASYEIKYDKLLTGKKEIKYYSEITTAQDNKTADLNQAIENQILSTKLVDNFFVQNYRESSLGQGWRASGVQRIINPDKQKIMLEEANGSISTYAVNNVIQTNADLSLMNGNLARGVSLNTWPDFAYSDAATGNIKKATYSASQYSVSDVGALPSVSGLASGYTYFDWTLNGGSFTTRECFHRYYFPGGSWCDDERDVIRYYELPRSTCKVNSYPYRQTTSPTKFLATSAGVYVIDKDRYNLGYLSNGQYTDLISNKSNMPKFSGQKTQNSRDPFLHTVMFDEQHLNEFFSSYPGLQREFNSTTNQQIKNVLRNETNQSYGSCGNPNNNVPASQGEFYVDGNLNKPSDIIQSIEFNKILIANSGTPIINVYDTQSGDVQNITLENNNHARGIAQDNAGNLYVSTKIGHIYKIDTNTAVQTIIAGNALDGIYTNESNPLRMKFENPYGLVFDNLTNSLYVADTGHNRVVRIDFNQNLATTVVGNGQAGFSGDGKSALEASLNAPTHIHIDQNRNLIIADTGNNKIRSMPLGNAVNSTLTYAPTNPDHSKLVKNPDGTWIRQYRSGQKELFNQNGYHLKSIGTNQLEINFQYDSNNRLTKIVFPTPNQEITYNYSSGLLSSIVDPAGKSTLFTYNNLNQLKTVTYPDSSQKRFDYDSSGLMTQETNQKNLVSNYSYNEFDRLLKISFSSDNSSISIQDSVAKGLKQADGSTAGVFIPKNNFETPDGIIDANGNKITMTKDVTGYISSITDPRGRTQKIKRDFEGRPIEITDVDQSIIQNKYDEVFGDLIESKNVTLNITLKKSYNIYGQVISQTDPNNKTATVEYNQKLQPIKQTASDGKYMTYVYNSLGQVTEKSSFNDSSVLQSKMIYEYDVKGQLLKQTNQDGKFSSYTYDLAGNVLTSTSNITSSQVASTIYEYNSMNRLTKVTSPKSEVTEYTYSDLGELTHIKDPNNKITEYEYDLKGQLTQKTDPTGAITKMTYDPNGNLLTEIDAANQRKDFSYNSVNKVTQVQTSDDLIAYNYNIKDEVIGISNNNAILSYERDLKQRITSETVAGNSQSINYPSHRIAYNYSLNDLRIQMTSPFQNINYSYNPNNYQLTGIQNSFGESFAFNYDQANRISSIQRPGSRTDFNYDVGSSLTSIIHSASSSIKSSFEYQYDLRNYITQKRSPASTLNYTYDSNGQLTNSDRAEAPAENEAFSYDALGNRLTYNGLNSTYDQTGQRIQDDGQYIYLYDANGNILAKNSKTNGTSYSFEYSAVNQLKKTTILAAPLSPIVQKIIEYKYDPVGRRIQRKVTDNIDPTKSNTKKYYYDGENILAETDDQNNVTASYTHSPLRPDDILSANFTDYAVSQSKGGMAISEGQVLADNKNAVYYLKDHLGSVTDIIGAGGNIIQKFDYTAYGTIRSVKNNLNQDVGFDNAAVRTSFTYTGREYEPETGMYYYRARYYDPNTGRFLQQDPDPGKLASPNTFTSKYIYAVNAPTMFTDPNGKNPLFIFAIAMGIINGGMNVMYAKDNRKNVSTIEYIETFLVGFASGFVGTYVASYIALWLGGGFLGGLAGSTVGGGVAGFVNNAGNQLTFNKSVDFKRAGDAAGQGALTGAISFVLYAGLSSISNIGAPPSPARNPLDPNAKDIANSLTSAGSSWWTVDFGIDSAPAVPDYAQPVPRLP